MKTLSMRMMRSFLREMMVSFKADLFFRKVRL